MISETRGRITSQSRGRISTSAPSIGRPDPAAITVPARDAPIGTVAVTVLSPFSERALAVTDTSDPPAGSEILSFDDTTSGRCRATFPSDNRAYRKDRFGGTAPPSLPAVGSGAKRAFCTLP